MIELLLNNQSWVVYLVSVMVISGYVKHYNLLMPIYARLLKVVKSKRGVVALISAITGVLPIPGRVITSAGFLDTIASPKKGKRCQMGIIDFMSTHHYYLWSPLEKTMIVPAAALGIGYFGMLSLTFPMLIAVLGVTIWYIFGYLKEDDIEIKTDEVPVWKLEFDWKSIPNPFKFINFELVVAMAGIIIIGNIAKLYSDDLKAIAESFQLGVPFALLFSFFASYLLGSSSRFAAFTTIFSLIFGIHYLPIFFAVDYAGYLFSPTHKCVLTGKMYFDTPYRLYFKAIGAMSLAATFGALVTMAFT